MFLKCYFHSGLYEADFREILQAPLDREQSFIVFNSVNCSKCFKEFFSNSREEIILYLTTTFYWTKQVGYKMM